MCWEVGVGLEELWGPGNGSQPAPLPMREAAWDQALHRLTAASVVQDNEQLALRGRAETTAEQGKSLSSRHTSGTKALNRKWSRCISVLNQPVPYFVTKDLR